MFKIYKLKKLFSNKRHKLFMQNLDGFSKNSLTYLASKYGTDKGINKHSYTLLYDLIFRGYKDREFYMIEMGLLIGGPEHGNESIRNTQDAPSIKMWLEYFPKAKIIGVDISDFSWFKHDRFNFIQLDMGDRKEYKKLYDIASKSEIIIDDASHASKHQQYAFVELFPLMPKGESIL